VEYVDIYIFKIRLSVTIRYSCSIVLGGECRSASAALRLGAGNAKKLREWDRHVLAAFEKKIKQPTYKWRCKMGVLAGFYV